MVGRLANEHYDCDDMVWEGVISIYLLTGMNPAFACPEKKFLRIG